MEYIFDCFFNETFTRLERSGLHARNKRKDVIDHLNAVISGCCKGFFGFILIRCSLLLYCFVNCVLVK